MHSAPLKIANLTKKNLTAKYVQGIVQEMEYRNLPDDKYGYATFLCDFNRLTISHTKPDDTAVIETPAPDAQIVVLTETKELNRSLTKGSAPPNMQFIFERSIFPGQPGYDEKLLGFMEPIKQELGFWCENFSEGRVPFDRLQKMCTELNPRIVVRHETLSSWNPYFDIDLGPLANFKNFVLSRFLIAPFFRGEGESFQRIKKCPVCGSFFFAERLGRGFCSNACRNKKYRGLKES